MEAPKLSSFSFWVKAFAVVGVGCVASALGWLLYRSNAMRVERNELRAGTRFLCTKALVNDVYLARSAVKMREVLGRSLPRGGVEGSLVVLSEAQDEAIRALFGERDMGSAPLGADPNDTERLKTVYETIASTDSQFIAACNAIVAALEPCMPGLLWNTEVTATHQDCTREVLKEPLKALNAYLTRNIRIAPSVATPRE
jgi:hypothetical protein